MIKIMLVDDHNLIREGIKQLLEFNDDMKVVAEYSNGQDCILHINDEPIDLLILDINMPVLNGIETLAQLRKMKCNMKVLLLTVHNEVEYILKGTEVGANGYILKDAGFDELKSAIYSIMNGEDYILSLIHI